MKIKNFVTFSCIAAMLFTHTSAESRVVLSRAGAPLKTTIPGDFTSLEAILPALFTLADQATDKSAEQAFIGVLKDRKDLIYYYRGVRVEDQSVVVSFSEDALPYFSGTVSFDAMIMRALVGTVMLYQPNAKEVKLEVGGKIWKNSDA